MNTSIIYNSRDVDTCVRDTKEFCSEFGFSIYKASLFAIAISEALVNAVRYANGAEFSMAYTQNNKGIEVQVKDFGKGIENLGECFSDGFSSTPANLGLGFGAMQRFCDFLR